MNELSFLFNTNKLYYDRFIPDLEKTLNNIVFSSSDLLVYLNNQLEVIVSDTGTVSISAQFNQLEELEKQLPLVINEYKKLSNTNKRFDNNYSVKVVAPNKISEEVIQEFKKLNYDINVINAENFELNLEKMH
ncbi:hypothetical protein [Priestia flexa]|uniref:hypothetical protein n=1 Tax=Priestia flexa TaxID=86664 RepID=UPI000473678B|nr:hypothetical protein [Priestia flexa]